MKVNNTFQFLNLPTTNEIKLDFKLFSGMSLQPGLPRDRVAVIIAPTRP